MRVPFFRSPWQDPAAAAGLGPELVRVLQSGQYILGPQVRAFEQAFSHRLNHRPVVGLNSGTDALVLALQMLDLQPGDEVILPSFTFFACYEAVVRAGARPVPADSQADDFLCTEAEMAACATPRTRAVLAVPLFGDASAIPAIARYCRAEGIPLVEDTAQALGASALSGTEWLPAGSMGDIGTLSFYPTKTLGAAGDAGALASPHPHFIERALSLRNHGLRAPLHAEAGLNSRMDELQATVLLQGLARMDGWLAQRQAIARRYLEHLADLPAITLPHDRPGHAWNYFVLRCPQRDLLQQLLRQQGVDTRIYYERPIHLQPACLDRFGAAHLPHAERHAQQALALPIYPGMAPDEIGSVVEAVRWAAVRLG
ncbi:DegT/DnrJ/EryC1/StrS family aminotransferase [Comamonas humi]